MNKKLIGIVDDEVIVINRTASVIKTWKMINKNDKLDYELKGFCGTEHLKEPMIAASNNALTINNLSIKALLNNENISPYEEIIETFVKVNKGEIDFPTIDKFDLFIIDLRGNGMNGVLLPEIMKKDYGLHMKNYIFYTACEKRGEEQDPFYTKAVSVLGEEAKFKLFSKDEVASIDSFMTVTRFALGEIDKDTFLQYMIDNNINHNLI